MSEDKKLTPGEEEANKETPENNSAAKAEVPNEEIPQPETKEGSSEDPAVPEAEAAPDAATEENPVAEEKEEAAAPESTEEGSEEPATEAAEPEAATEAPDEAAPEDSPEETTTTEEAPAAEATHSEAVDTPVAEDTAETPSDSTETANEPEAAAETTSTDTTDALEAETEAAPEEEAPETEAPKAEDTSEASSDSPEPAAETPSTDVADAPETEAAETPEKEETTATEEAPAAEVEASTTADTEAPVADAAEAPEAASAESTETTSEETEPEEESVEDMDFSNHTREELAEVVDELSKQDNFKRSDAILSKVLPLFKGMARARRQEALEKFLADGGSQDDFEYRHDEVFNRFDASVRLIRDRRASYYKEREARKEENYNKKLEILDKLRELIDGENATTNLSPIKALQEEWKALGPVPAQHNRTLWANYNALLDRFYNNRHILFELKELDRKKNLVKKTELCEKAEALDKLENIKDAIIQLNELHEEYKKIGAVPREVQEQLWQRFKTASDAIYKKRKSYLEDLKGELQQNLEKKRALADELRPYLDFDSDRINDWNAKTKEILAIQKRWDALGGLPREYAKEVNKAFWGAFKGFFSRKNAFFKKLEGMRHENLKKKEELVAKAVELSASTDWDKTSEALKGLQRQWKEIGPVPEKHRNSVYAKFKEACDAFFNNRRASQDKAEAQYVENQKHKEALITEVGERAAAGDGKADELDDIMTRWNAIGFVPRSAIKSVEEKFAKALDAFVKSLDIADEEREALVMKAELNSLKKGPNSDRRLNKKESDLRRKVKEVEDNIAQMTNNLAFFANSKGADKLREEYDQKIAQAEEELAQLKKQLRMVRSM